MKGGGGSDDMFFNSLVNIVGVLYIPFFISSGEERGFAIIGLYNG